MLRPLRHLLRFSVVLATLGPLLGCPPRPVTPPPDADAASVVDAGPPAPPGDAGYDCVSWCARAALMRCPAALPTASGASCADVCANTLDGPAPFKVACRSVAPSCVAADACEDAATVSSETTLVLVGKTPEAGPAASARQAAASPSCATWCAHAKALGCPASLPTLKGASCVEVCSNVQKGPVPWDLRCRAEAKTCATADACEKR